MVDLNGRSLGRYNILEQLGEGGMATVYKAYDPVLDIEVAVKVIRTENILPIFLDRALRRFEREAKALAKLAHPNIVKVTDYGENGGRPYLVMPYFSGGTLKQKLGKAIAWQEALCILLPIIEALEYAHGQNIIHRDVKPSNILFTQQGQPMLTDFGIAKVLDSEETMDLTATSAAVGTPEYMAPEQATSKTVDHRADIYALGIVLYEMITGKKPFTADTPLAVLFMHASEPIPRPRQSIPNLPDGIEKVLMTLLAKKPADRYQSMAELETALKKIINKQAKKSDFRKKLVFPDHFLKNIKKTILNSFRTFRLRLLRGLPLLRKLVLLGVAGALLLTSVQIAPKLIMTLSSAFSGTTATSTAFPGVKVTSTSTSQAIDSNAIQIIQSTPSPTPENIVPSEQANNPQFLAVLPVGNPSRLDAVRWSPDSKSIAFAGSDGTSDVYKVSLYLYDLENDETTHLIDNKSMQGTVSQIAFNKSQNYLAVGFRDFNASDGRMVALWRKNAENNWEEYESINLVPGYGEASVVFTELKQSLAYGFYGGAGLWDLQEKKLVDSYSGLEQNVYGEKIFFLNEEEYIGYGWFTTIIVRSVEDGSLIVNLPGRLIGIFEDAQAIVGLKTDAYGRRTLYMYEINSQEEYIIDSSVPEYADDAFSLSENGSIFSFSDWNASRITVYDLITREKIFFRQSRGPAIVFPSGSAVTIYDSASRTSEIFDLASGEKIASVNGQIISVAPDSAHVLVQLHGKLQIWSLLQ